MSPPAIAVDIDPLQPEPSVFGAVRRYRVMVVAVTILAVVAGAGYSLAKPKAYRAQAFITMPQQVSVQGQAANPGQYLDSQVLILESQNVAQQAATIANSTLHENLLTAGNFSGPKSSLEISPPVSAAPGAYGGTVIGVSFTASPAKVAEAGTNAVIQAYDQTRSATIKSQDNAVISGINAAIASTDTQLAALLGQKGFNAVNQQQMLVAQRTTLYNQRTQALVNEQIDLAQQPSVAIEPATTANHKWALDAGIGLIAGFLVGGALAFARDSRRRHKIAARQARIHLDGGPSRSYAGGQPLSASERWSVNAASFQPPQG